ncbi:MAG: alpha/beta hydrolase [Erysipelotrichaceae bacterium]|nr:alpha/beta hydrolase [Erysipelotrichaceae bacterium]
MRNEMLDFENRGHIHVVVWDQVESPALGVIQIVHGMAERIERYQQLAAYLNKKGFIVVGQSLRGHGQHAADQGELGCLGEPGWEGLIKEVDCVSCMLEKRYPDLPKIMLGHSMGSFVARTLLFKDIMAGHFCGVVLSGTGDQPRSVTLAGWKLAQIQSAIFGPRKPSKLLTTLSFGAYNKRFAPNRTAFDWLSRDDARVDDYVRDPLCGSVFSASFFRDFLKGLLYLDEMEKNNKLHFKGPILFISGADDPLQNNGKTFERLIPLYQTKSTAKIEKHLFPGARHELLNELNREEVYDMIATWLEQRCCS